MGEITVVGYGDRFDALIDLFQHTNTDVQIWNHNARKKTKLPKGIRVVPLEALADSPVIFFSLPIEEVRDVARELGTVVTGRHAIVHLCRNLENKTLKTVSEVLREETPTHRFGFLTGPMRHEDISQGMPGSGTCATIFPEVQEVVESALVSRMFRLYRSDDIRGAELAASYCRVIAFACGVASELHLGHSLMATLFSRGLAEMGRFVVHRGGRERTTFGMAGSGNLFMDIAATGSEDFMIGQTVMRANAFDRKALLKEYGPRAKDLFDLVDSLGMLSEDRKLALHILQTCALIVHGKMLPAEALLHLMTLPVLTD
jgi:glycerol-3-phosphate dehydrogenase (NAD(P)+)